MRLINPYFSKQTQAEQEVNTYQAEVETWLQNNTDRKSVTFDQIRKFFGKTAEQWPDGVIHSRLSKWGYEVES